MSRYPRAVRKTRVKCVDCNAPAAETIENDYICVECGTAIIATND